MEKYLEGEEITEDEIKAAIRRARSQRLVPILCGTAFKNKGVQPLLDAVIDYLPSPLDVPPVDGTTQGGDESRARAADDEPFAALAFKIVTDPHVGKLTYFRVYSGKLDKGDRSQLAPGKKERVGRILEMHANQREDIDVAAPATSSPASASRTTRPATRCATRRPDHARDASTSPSR